MQATQRPVRGGRRVGAGCRCRAACQTVHHSRRAPGQGRRWLGSSGGRQLSRVPVPEDVAGALRFANENPEAVGDDFFETLKVVMEGLIEDQLPEGATEVRAILDEVRTEFVVTWREA
jgi:hypothetical protein